MSRVFLARPCGHVHQRVTRTLWRRTHSPPAEGTLTTLEPILLSMTSLCIIPKPFGPCAGEYCRPRSARQARQM
jgi:hypothetical protein